MNNSKIIETYNNVNEFISERADLYREQHTYYFTLADDVLTETVVIKKEDTYKKVKQSFAIGVYPDSDSNNRNFIKDPYFKVFNGRNPNSSDKIVRISIFRPEYIIHLNQKWNLNSKEKHALMEILETVIDNERVWDKILKACIIESKNSIHGDDLEQFLNTPIPDYTQLTNIK